MQAISLDILEKAALPSVQARAIAEVVDIEIASRSDVLATKLDVSKFETRIVERIGKSESDVMRWVFLNTLALAAILLGCVYFMITHALPAR